MLHNAVALLRRYVTGSGGTSSDKRSSDERSSSPQVVVDAMVHVAAQPRQLSARRLHRRAQRLHTGCRGGGAAGLGGRDLLPRLEGGHLQHLLPTSLVPHLRQGGKPGRREAQIRSSGFGFGLALAWLVAWPGHRPAGTLSMQGTAGVAAGSEGRRSRRSSRCSRRSGRITRSRPPGRRQSRPEASR